MNTKTSKSLGRHLVLSALLCTCFMAFPFRVQAETFVNPLTNPTPAEFLFNWAELNYPGLFAPSGAPWAVASIDWTYLYYSLTNA